MLKTKQLVFLALFLCTSLVICYFENLIPPIVPIAGVKLGLANCITLVVLKLYDAKKAASVLFLRIIIASLFFGGAVQFLYSLSGGILSFLVLCVLSKKISSLTTLSAFSAIFHNIGQLATAVFITRISFLWWYIFPLTASAIIGGTFTGLISGLVLKNNYILNLAKERNNI